MGTANYEPDVPSNKNDTLQKQTEAAAQTKQGPPKKKTGAALEKNTTPQTKQRHLPKQRGDVEKGGSQDLGPPLFDLRPFLGPPFFDSSLVEKGGSQILGPPLFDTAPFNPAPLT